MKTRDVIILLMIMIVAVTVLLALGKEADSLIAFMIAAIVPTIAVILNGKQMDKIGKGVEETRENSGTIVHQTNGRMTELINTNAELIAHLASSGVTIDPALLEAHNKYDPEHLETKPATM